MREILEFNPSRFVKIAAAVGMKKYICAKGRYSLRQIMMVGVGFERFR